MIKSILIIGMVWSIGGGNLLAQNNACVKKTFVLRKKTVTAKIEKEVPDVKQAKVKVESVSATKGVKKQPAKLPTIAGGTFGLLDIQVYREGMSFYNWNYVVLQYDVSQYGWAINIKAEQYSSRRFADYIIRKLKATKWNPALDQSNQPMDYTLYKQAVIVKQKLHEEDYRKQY